MNTFVHEIESSKTTDQEVEIDLLIDIPQSMKIRYKPDSADLTVKFLMQYIALLIPSIYICYEIILGWGFRRNLLKTKTVSEIKTMDITDKKNKSK